MTVYSGTHWANFDDEFATCIEILDVKGFFAKSVLIEPGFRASFIEKWQSLVELPPRQHTLSNIVDRMKPLDPRATIFNRVHHPTNRL